MRLLLTRPEPDAAPIARQLRALGHQVVCEPAMEIVFAEEPAPRLEGVQGLLFTSANGVRAFCAASPERHRPAFAVGPATAQAARAAGFGKVFEAGGDVDALAALVAARADPAGGPLLHVAGSHRAGDLAGRLEAAGLRLERAVLYEARARQALSAEAEAALRAGVDGVLLFSPRTARLFEGLVRRAGLSSAMGETAAYCLSPAVAEAAGGLSWGRILAAPQPRTEALLALIGD